MKRLALVVALAACGRPADPGLALVARRDGEHGYLLWGRTAVAGPLELSVEDGERVLFGPVPLPVRGGRFRVDFALEPTASPVVYAFLADAAGTREWRVALPRARREVRFGAALPSEPPPPELIPPGEHLPVSQPIRN